MSDFCVFFCHDDLPFSRNGVVSLQIRDFAASDVGTYECVAKNEHGDMSQPVIMVMAQASLALKLCVL